MHRDYIKWWSPRLERDMELLVFGHAGTPILAFPSSKGRFFEWESFGMVEALSHQLENGHNRLYCVDSVDAESFYNYSVDPYVRIVRHRQYEGYVMEEVLPLISDSFVIAAGASFGAYHAANMVFKHPWRFGKLIALSGAYDIRSFLYGFYDENVYFNNPIDYLSNLGDHGTLDAIRQNHIVLTAGEYDPSLGSTLHLSGILRDKGVSHHLEIVEGAFGHDWPWWRQQIGRHIG